jgi:hypothetical protein
MKSEFDREIDALLRRATQDAARRAEPLRAAVAAEDAAAAAHLDADELSAYAENALPPSARARYAAHLSDCDHCRRLATSIALASNVALKSDEKAEAHAPSASDAHASSGWRARLAALFAPRTLGYALPVLAVCVFAIVALIALRDSRDGGTTQLAKHEPANAEPAAIPSADVNANTSTATTNMTADTAVANTNTATPSAQQTSDAAPTQNQPDAPKAGPSGGTIGVTTQPAPVAPVASPMIGQGQRQDGTGEFSVEFARTAPSVPPPARMEAPRSTATTSADTAAAATQNRANVAGEHKSEADESASVASARARNEAPRREMSKQRNDASGGEMEERAQMMRRAPDGARSSRARRSGNADSSPEDAAGMGATRSAAGHRFRRQGGAWVDVRYDEGMRMTNVRRGTEHFRSLAADIPELERVASQLDGEVIVVIGNRAYRIR